MMMKWDPDRETSEKWRLDASNWKLGIFYFNRADNRMFVPKRHAEFGATLNMAHPVSLLMMLLFVLFWTGIIIFAGMYQP